MGYHFAFIWPGGSSLVLPTIEVITLLWGLLNAYRLHAWPRFNEKITSEMGQTISSPKFSGYMGVMISMIFVGILLGDLVIYLNNTSGIFFDSVSSMPVIWFFIFQSVSFLLGLSIWLLSLQKRILLMKFVIIPILFLGLFVFWFIPHLLRTLNILNVTDPSSLFANIFIIILMYFGMGALIQQSFNYRFNGKDLFPLVFTTLFGAALGIVGYTFAFRWYYDIIGTLIAIGIVVLCMVIFSHKLRVMTKDMALKTPSSNREISKGGAE